MDGVSSPEPVNVPGCPPFLGAIASAVYNNRQTVLLVFILGYLLQPWKYLNGVCV